MTASFLLIALAIDHVLGWPDALYHRIGHPVTWLGKLITKLDQNLNHPTQLKPVANQCLGLFAMLIVVGICALIGVLLQAIAALHTSTGWLVAVAAWPLLATRSLREHVEAVARPLIRRDLAGARVAVSMIVGRNPDVLDESGVASAALESLAENTSDGIVAPLFWAWLFGLPGLFVYKGVNTLDSMIGHRNDRYEHFGKASALLDDLMNLIPARLTGLLLALQAVPQKRPLLSALNSVRQEAPQHRSPNAGWPEAAMAYVLNIRLAGPRRYDDVLVEEPYFNAKAPAAAAEDLQRGLHCYRRLLYAIIALLLALALPSIL